MTDARTKAQQIRDAWLNAKSWEQLVYGEVLVSEAEIKKVAAEIAEALKCDTK